MSNKSANTQRIKSYRENKNLSAVQASLGHSEQRTTQVYAKTVALLSSEMGEKTAEIIFKDSHL